MSKIKADLVEVNGRVCFFCGRRGYQLVHIIRKSYSFELSYEKKNCILGCQDCHDTFDNGSAEEILELKNLEYVLLRMKELDELYFNRFMDRLTR